MLRRDATQKTTGIGKRILALTITSSMIFSYFGNLKLPAVYAANQKTLDTTTAEQPLTISPATPKNADSTSATYTDAQGVEYTLNSDLTCAVSECSAYAKNTVVIPEQITVNNTTYRVTSIKKQAFYYCSYITNISLPESLITIGSRAFGLCKRLSDITIPASVTSIGINAFISCDSLTAFHVNENNQHYMSLDGVLYNKSGDTLICCPCKKKSLNIPSTVTKIGEDAFFRCFSLSSVTIPSSVKEIGSSAFSYCESLSSVTIPSSVTTIGAHAFSNCRTLTNVTIPESVETISVWAFARCTSLTNITIPSSVTYIGNGAFTNCVSLTTVANRSKITTLEADTFQNCHSLTKVNIPETVTSIEDSAFENCIALKSITIPSKVNTISNSAFLCCTALTGITLPNSITSIGDYAFFGCQQLKSVIIPSNTQTIGEKAFSHCKNVTIYGEPNSKGESYAKNNGLPFYAAYQIIYQLNGGTNNSKNPNMHTTKADVSLASPKRLGYTFKGWYTTAKFKANSKVTKISKKSKGTVTLYAKWEKVKTPKKATLKTAKSKKSGTLTISTKKVNSVSGYEYTVATDKKFTKNFKTVTSKKVTTTVKGLKKGKNYYVKVRAYKLDSTNRKIYGKYSSIKKVKVKK